MGRTTWVLKLKWIWRIKTPLLYTVFRVLTKKKAQNYRSNFYLKLGIYKGLFYILTYFLIHAVVWFRGSPRRANFTMINRSWHWSGLGELSILVVKVLWPSNVSLLAKRFTDFSISRKTSKILIVFNGPSCKKKVGANLIKTKIVCSKSFCHLQALKKGLYLEAGIFFQGVTKW